MESLQLENEGYEQRIGVLIGIEKEVEELKGRYSVVLELLGEREERVRELEEDIEDMKEAFKIQLNKEYK